MSFEKHLPDKWSTKEPRFQLMAIRRTYGPNGEDPVSEYADARWSFLVSLFFFPHPCSEVLVRYLSGWGGTKARVDV